MLATRTNAHSKSTPASLPRRRGSTESLPCAPMRAKVRFTVQLGSEVCFNSRHRFSSSSALQVLKIPAAMKISATHATNAFELRNRSHTPVAIKAKKRSVAPIVIALDICSRVPWPTPTRLHSANPLGLQTGVSVVVFLAAIKQRAAGHGRSLISARPPIHRTQQPRGSVLLLLVDRIDMARGLGGAVVR
jgi:hypothetical protein